MQKRSTRLYLAVCAGIALVAALSVPAYAHHGWGGNSSEETELTGTVELLSLSGPHATMKVRVGDQLWDVTLAPPARAQPARGPQGSHYSDRRHGDHPWPPQQDGRPF